MTAFELCKRMGHPPSPVRTRCVAFTRAGFMDFADTVYRDMGHYGRHSKRCVRLASGFVCADDCRMRQPRKHGL